MNTTPRPQITLDVTIAGETRPVDFEVIGPNQDQAYSTSYTVALATIGRGSARYTSSLIAWKRGDSWTVSRDAVVRNRQARIVAWNDDNATNAHNNARKA